MLRLQDNPPMLPESVASVTELEGNWWVAHTKPRCEKAVAFDLLFREIGYYLPMAHKTIISGGRKRRSLIPIFTSYVFFCGDQEARTAAFHTDRIVQVLPVTQRQKFVTELWSIERTLAVNGQLEQYPFAAVGRRVRVRCGAFMGIEGIVVRRDHRPLLVLQVSMLGCGAALEIDPSLLEPVDEAEEC